MNPDDRKYTKTHEWIKLDNDAATIGITDHAQTALGDITFVELPANGLVVEQGKECGVVESVKAASDIFAPASGEVLESNSELEDKPELINQDPYGNGWMFRMSVSDTGELDSLMDAADYKAFSEAET